MAIEVDAEKFEEMVDAALGAIPEELLARVENCVVLVADEPEPELGDVLGYYDGIPLSQRTSQYSGVLPDRILIFRGPLCHMVDSAEELVDQVRITVWHEMAHYFGIDDDDLDAWGYA